jgi:hypothetical protein
MNAKRISLLREIKNPFGEILCFAKQPFLPDETEQNGTKCLGNAQFSETGEK